jgi:iron(III) transport system ATP-binding protein
MNGAVQTSELIKRFGGEAVVDGFSISVEPGRILSLVGPSGCGKTTALRLIAGFETPDGGVIIVGGRTVYGHGLCVPPEKRRTGMVFQDYALFPHLSVAGNAAFGLDKGPSREPRVREVLSLAGLAGLESRMPHELSGGQQQRLALARALAPEPDVLLLDEPFSNLDAVIRAGIREEVKEILKRSGSAAVFVTHDRDEALHMGDSVSVMSRGRIEQTSSPHDIYHRPASRFVARFMGIADFLPCTISNASSSTEIGNPAAPLLPRGSGDGLEIMVRPDDIVIVPAAAGNGTVSSSAFQGASYLYRVLLDSGSTVHSQGSHSVKIEPGTRVAASLDKHYVPVFFRDGRMVE